MSHPTGEQYQIRCGDHEAVITEQGATLRSLRHRGRELLSTFGVDASPVGCQGQQLLPWPNRIRDGRYSFGGQTHQLPVNEVERNNALHGLAAWVGWQLLHHTDTDVAQQLRILPRPGYEFMIEVSICHRLETEGLVVEVSVRNIGREDCPWGYAAHPYFALGGPIDQWVIDSPFVRYLEVEQPRLLPVALHEVAGTDWQLTASAPLNDRQFDHAFTDAGGRGWAIGLSGTEASIELWADQELGWLQIYTPSDRCSLAVEPMSCGPDAFNEGVTRADLVVVGPGQEWSSRWGIRPL